MSTARAFAFGSFLLIPERQLLLHDDKQVRIGCRALDLLTVLVERAGELVTKKELMARAWPTTIVDECNLKVNISVLRRALDATAVGTYIATTTGRGYRFVAPVDQRMLPSSGTCAVSEGSSATCPPLQHYRTAANDSLFEPVGCEIFVDGATTLVLEHANVLTKPQSQQARLDACQAWAALSDRTAKTLLFRLVAKDVARISVLEPPSDSRSAKQSEYRLTN